MREISLILTVFFAVFCSIEAVPFIQKCKTDDSKCVKASSVAAIPIFAAGIPEYGVKTLDPITFPKIDASSPNLKLILTDVTFKGLKDCQAKKIKIEKSKGKLLIKLLCSVDMDGSYEMNGKLLILPIEGKGPIHVKLRKAEVNVEVDVDFQSTKWNIKEWKHSYELKDNSEVVFENLFNGNEVLASAARDVIANSGNEIITEVGPPVIKTVVDEVIKSIKAFFDAVPASELALD
ncbi:Circadian clock-controlled protein [Papilio machaon]|uniref:Circadian clock-controlled protein n=1 Tax=Papilio machaon TaxID=76193 RepID=A0A194R9S8_PAPMA|nr:Circadian clock-controlled protein [Papilio machaon]